MGRLRFELDFRKEKEKVDHLCLFLVLVSWLQPLTIYHLLPFSTYYTVFVEVEKTFINSISTSDILEHYSGYEPEGSWEKEEKGLPLKSSISSFIIVFLPFFLHRPYDSSIERSTIQQT